MDAMSSLTNSTQPEKTLRILSLDSALITTGYSVVEVSTGNFHYKIKGMGLIETEPGADEDTRLRLILSQMFKLVHEFSSNCILLEYPSETIYGFNRISKPAIVGRASSIAKLKAVGGAIIGACYVAGIYCRPIQPVQWQLGGPRNAKMDSKRWSVGEANKILQSVKHPRKLSLSKNKSDGDIADSLNIALFTVKQYYYKKWEIPNVS